MGKYFAAKALNISNSVLYDSGVLIDEVIIVPDFETMVDGMVNDLNVETLEIEKRAFLFSIWMGQEYFCRAYSHAVVRFEVDG